MVNAVAVTSDHRSSLRPRLNYTVFLHFLLLIKRQHHKLTRNVGQPDGCRAEYRWRPLLNAAVWLTTINRAPCSNAAKTQNPLKLPGVPQTNETISAASGPKFTIL